MNPKKDKKIFGKAQLKMGENIAIIFIFILLVVFGLVFFSKLQGKGIETKQIEGRELAAVQLAQKVSYIPELRCSNENVPVPDCYDALKMALFKNISDKDQSNYYYNIMSYSTIWVEEIWPSQNRTWVVYNRTKANATGGEPFQIPISVYDPLTGSLGSYSFGILHIYVWS